MDAVRKALIEYRRWVILDTVAQISTRTLNEQIVMRIVSGAGVPIGAEDLRNDLLLLEQAGCVTIERMPRPPGGDLWVATLTREGLEVRDCARTVHGVASRRPL